MDSNTLEALLLGMPVPVALAYVILSVVREWRAERRAERQAHYHPPLTDAERHQYWAEEAERATQGRHER